MDLLLYYSTLLLHSGKFFTDVHIFKKSMRKFQAVGILNKRDSLSSLNITLLECQQSGRWPGSNQDHQVWDSNCRLITANSSHSDGAVYKNWGLLTMYWQQHWVCKITISVKKMTAVDFSAGQRLNRRAATACIAGAENVPNCPADQYFLGTFF